jgi:hypothetical protein
MLASVIPWLNAELRLAFPWQLTIGAAVSFLVCVLGSPRDDGGPARPGADPRPPGA